jgi:uncharacterized protein CbrC (UPF0167 family)
MECTFPYYADVDSVFVKKTKQCDLCGKKVESWYIWGCYGERDFDFICCECIKNWKIKQYWWYFNEVCDESIDFELIDVIKYRTPSLISYQQHCWPVCCKVPCCYEWLAKLADIEKNKNVEDGLSTAGFANLVKKGYVLKFKCLVCWRVHFVIDMD